MHLYAIYLDSTVPIADLSKEFISPDISMVH